MSPVISHPRSAAARHQSDELSPITITVDCPAKTNLTLEVGPAHDEWGGRHELDTIYCAIGVYDTVTATAKQPGAGFSLELEGAYLGDLASSRSDMRRNQSVLALFAMAQALSLRHIFEGTTGEVAAFESDIVIDSISGSRYCPCIAVPLLNVPGWLTFGSPPTHP